MTTSARAPAGMELGGREPALSTLQQIMTEPGTTVLFRCPLVDPTAAGWPRRGAARPPGGSREVDKVRPSCSVGLACRASVHNQPESQKIPEIFRCRVPLKTPKFLCYCLGGIVSPDVRRHPCKPPLGAACGQPGSQHVPEPAVRKCSLQLISCM